ncbi:MAG: hypothetical protein AAF483_10120 [Planctomycetota bacterium]
MTVNRTLALTFPVLLLTFQLQVRGEVIIDFGNTFSAGANVNQISATQQDLADAINTSGVSTGISFSIQNGNGFHPTFTNGNGDPTPGNPASGIFDSGTTQDSLFGHNASFGGTNRPLVEYQISGLNPSNVYTFNMYASRMDASGNRTTDYAISGINSGAASLDAAFANNGDSGALATIASISPTASGTLSFTIQAGESNNTAEQFFYIGGLQFYAVPEPSGVAILAILGLPASIRSRHRRASTR